jgi:hypothetical protein
MSKRRDTNNAILAIIGHSLKPPKLRNNHLKCMAGDCLHGDTKAEFLAPQISMDPTYPFVYVPICAGHRENWIIEGDKYSFPNDIVPPIFKIPPPE